MGKMIKSEFKYDNRDFKYKFRIIEWCNQRGYGASIIKYKYKIWQMSKDISIEKHDVYKYLLNKYNDMEEEELKREIERLIIKDYEYYKLKKKWY